MKLSAELAQFPALAQLAAHADHVDVKTFEGEVTFREFIAGVMNYMPGWMKFLYGVRWVFVRLLGMTQTGIPTSANMRPEAVPMQPGQRAAFFKLVTAEEDRLWIVCADEAHLAAYLAVVAEPISETRRRFHLITIVHYHQWTGNVYFGVIRPFHHLVVNAMAQHALHGADTA